METPNLKHISEKDYEVVYEPAEDSFLMIDALELEMNTISKLQPAVFLEVGSGSGINITAFAKVFKSCFCLCVDINMKACEISIATGKANSAIVESVNMDLLTCIKSRVIDVIIFNPPYVITESLEIERSNISRTWAGGINGREVIDRFLHMIPQVLADSGVCYMLVLEENFPAEIKRIMTDLGYSTTCIIKRKARNEKLQVLKFSKSCTKPK